METQSTEYPEIEAQDEEYPQVEIPGDAYPQAEVQVEEYPEVEVQDEEYAEVESQHEEDVAVATRAFTLRMDSVLMLIVGLAVGALLGYMGRPLITPQSQTTGVATSERGANAPASDSSAKAARPSTSDTTKQTLMDTLIAQTRHFKGDPNAPVTIIEFSDFQ